jgi:hypothetical protein
VWCLCLREVLGFIGHSLEFQTFHVSLPLSSSYRNQQEFMSYTFASIEGPNWLPAGGLSLIKYDTLL